METEGFLDQVDVPKKREIVVLGKNEKDDDEARSVGVGADADAVLHLLPFGFKDYSGPARVSTFFIVTPMELPSHIPANTQQLLYEATFRGRELRGAKVKVPSGFQGVILREDEVKNQQEAAEGVSDHSNWKVHSHFNEFYYWNVETTPSTLDRPRKWLQWPDVAALIHKPVSKEEMEAEKKNQRTEKNTKSPSPEKAPLSKRRRTSTESSDLSPSNKKQKMDK